MAPVNMLSDDSNSGEDLDQITVNEHYAKAYAYRKERQELERREHLLLSLHPIHDSQMHQAALLFNHARLR